MDDTDDAVVSDKFEFACVVDTNLNVRYVFTVWWRFSFSTFQTYLTIYGGMKNRSNVANDFSTFVAFETLYEISESGFFHPELFHHGAAVPYSLNLVPWNVVPYPSLVLATTFRGPLM